MVSYGKTSELVLKTDEKNGKSYISDVRFTAPFKILPPFYDNNLMEVTILSVSAGLMEGDRQNITIDIGRNSNVMISSQTFEKIHRMKEGKAKRNTYIHVDPEAYLIYKPLPTIPYADSKFDNETIVNLVDSSSVFIYSEILTCGRVFHGEKFEFEHFKNYTEIHCDKKLVYRDNTLFEPKKMPLEDFGFFEGFTHLGNLICCNLDDPDYYQSSFYDYLAESDLEFGITKSYYGIVVVKILGTNSDKILESFDHLINMVNIL